METAIVFPLITKFLPITDPALFAFFWSFLAIGYMTYDLMHYSLHHIDTSKHKGGWFHKLQKYHNQHHFGGEEAGFGVSSPLWDFIIGTTYKNKLK
jgi:sterol desaturase/sphingolipid hydroxylase (fatty acid hydroxylase superfamily)